jgi:hypothetical protein
MKSNRNIQIHLSIPSKYLDQIEELMEEKRIPSKTQAIQFLIRIGLRMDEFKVKCDNPEFVRELDREWRVEEIIDWIDNMPHEQREIIGRAWEISKRQRDREFNAKIR